MEKEGATRWVGDDHWYLPSFPTPLLGRTTKWKTHDHWGYASLASISDQFKAAIMVECVVPAL